MHIGYVADRDLPALYSGATALVYPSRYEGFGLPVLEAMACGTAVITTNVASLPEVAGTAAVMLDEPDDARALADAMLTLAQDARRRSQCETDGLAQAAQFSLEQMNARLSALYHRLLEV